MLPRVLGLACILLGALAASLCFDASHKNTIAQDNRWEVPSDLELVPVPEEVKQAIAQGRQTIFEVESQLSSLIEKVEQGEESRSKSVEELSQKVASALQDLDTSTKQAVVQLVSTTVEEKTAELKAECQCDCDCDAKLAEVTQQLEELRNRVTQLESSQIKPGMPPPEVAQRLQAMGYRSSAYGSSVASSGGGGSAGSIPSSPPVTSGGNFSYQASQEAVYQQSFQPPVMSNCVQNPDGTMSCNANGQPAQQGGLMSGGFGARLRSRFSGN